MPAVNGSAFGIIRRMTWRNPCHIFLGFVVGRSVCRILRGWRGIPKISYAGALWSSLAIDRGRIRWANFRGRRAITLGRIREVRIGRNRHGPVGLLGIAT